MFLEMFNKTAFPAFESDAASLSNSGNADSLSKNILRSDRGGDDTGATWMHRQLALKFAAWLDPSFEVWIYQTVDALIYNHSKMVTEEIKEKAKLVAKKEQLIKSLAKHQDFIDYLEVETKLQQTSYRITKINKNQLEVFRNS